MFLRGILLQNFFEILKEVSLICGAATASTLLYYLYCSSSLKSQFKQTGQLDSGVTRFLEPEQQ